jgi:hypothetical protein
MIGHVDGGAQLPVVGLEDVELTPREAGIICPFCRETHLAQFAQVLRGVVDAGFVHRRSIGEAHDGDAVSVAAALDIELARGEVRAGASHVRDVAHHWARAVGEDDGEAILTTDEELRRGVLGLLLSLGGRNKGSRDHCGSTQRSF